MTARVDEDRVVLEALDFEVPCEVDGGCSCAATVSLSCRHCGMTVLLCEGHVAAYRRWFEKVRGRGMVVVCKSCHVHMPSFDVGFVVVNI